MDRRHRFDEGEVGQEAVLDHLQHDRRRAHLQELRHLAAIRVSDDHVQPPVLLGVCVRLVAGVDDRALQGRLEAHLGLEEVRPGGELVPGRGAVVPGPLEPHLARAGEHLSRDEERRQVADDVCERGRAVDQVVLMGAVRIALAVGVVLVDRQGRRLGHVGREHVERPFEDPLPRLVVDHEVARREALRCRVLRVRVVNVVARAVGQDHVRQAEVLVGHLATGLRLEPTRVAHRRLVLVVPPDLAQAPRVGGDQHRRRQHGVEVRLTGCGDAVLGLGPHDLRDGHQGTVPRGYRYCPALTRSTCRPSPSRPSSVRT